MITPRGIHSVLYSLFDEAGAIDHGAMRAQAQLVRDLGVDGVTVLGLATEVGKLREAERRALVETVTAEVAGTLPFSVTIYGNSVAEQRAGLEHALGSGADWVILQPPGAGKYSSQSYLEFFAAVADGFDTSIALQNAPEYLGVGLSEADIGRLTHMIPGFRCLKAEAPAIEFASMRAAAPNDIALLNGRGGLQMMECLSAKADGFILAPDLIDLAIAAFASWKDGNHATSAEHHQRALPAICFIMQSLEHLICYGKRLFGYRAGFTIHDRVPSLKPTPFGLSVISQYAKELGGMQQPSTDQLSDGSSRRPSEQ